MQPRAARHGARSYIVPTYPTVEPFARRFYPPDLGPITAIPPTGNAPVLLTRADMVKIIPLWAQARRAPRRRSSSAPRRCAELCRAPARAVRSGD